jgi:hypothetical protein
MRYVLRRSTVGLFRVWATPPSMQDRKIGVDD